VKENAIFVLSQLCLLYPQSKKTHFKSLWSLLHDKYCWTFKKSKNPLVSFDYLPPTLSSAQGTPDVDYATSEDGVIKLVYRKTSEWKQSQVTNDSNNSSRLSPTNGSGDSRDVRFKTHELFLNFLFLLTGLKDSLRKSLAKNLTRCGGQIMSSIKDVHKTFQKAKTNNTDYPSLIVLSDANIKSHRRAKYQYAVAMHAPALHYSWATDCIRKRTFVQELDPYMLPIGVELHTGIVKLPPSQHDAIPPTDSGPIFEDLTILLLLKREEVNEWQYVLETAGAHVVTCNHFNHTSHKAGKIRYTFHFSSNFFVAAVSC
jgi:hypothetical protein